MLSVSELLVAQTLMLSAELSHLHQEHPAQLVQSLTSEPLAYIASVCAHLMLPLDLSVVAT